MVTEHTALYCTNLQRLSAFYQQYFGAKPGPLYHNPAIGFESVFLTFPGSGNRLEIMFRKGIDNLVQKGCLGYHHLALHLGSQKAVEKLARRLAKQGVPVQLPTQTAGSPLYGCTITDPEGNTVEISA